LCASSLVVGAVATLAGGELPAGGVADRTDLTMGDSCAAWADLSDHQAASSLSVFCGSLAGVMSWIFVLPSLTAPRLLGITGDAEEHDEDGDRREYDRYQVHRHALTCCQQLCA
jgi:hypothetical protein